LAYGLVVFVYPEWQVSLFAISLDLELLQSRGFEGASSAVFAHNTLIEEGDFVLQPGSEIDIGFTPLVKYASESYSGTSRHRDRSPDGEPMVRVAGLGAVWNHIESLRSGNHTRYDEIAIRDYQAFRNQRAEQD